MRPRYGVTSWFLPERGRGAIEWAAEAKFASIQVDMADVAQASVTELLAASKESGVVLAGLAISTLEAIGPHGEEAASAVVEALEVAAFLGIGYVYLPSFGKARIHSSEELLATARLLKLASESAANTGIVIATENTLAPHLLTTLFRSADRPEVDLLFDTQNLSVSDTSAEDVLHLHRSRVRHCVHVKDGSREFGSSRLGEGDADVAKSLDFIIAGGYSGSFIIESDYRGGSLAEAYADQAWLTERLGDSEKAETHRDL